MSNPSGHIFLQAAGTEFHRHTSQTGIRAAVNSELTLVQGPQGPLATGLTRQSVSSAAALPAAKPAAVQAFMHVSVEI
jgi:hypothetical protein